VFSRTAALRREALVRQVEQEARGAARRSYPSSFQTTTPVRGSLPKARLPDAQSKLDTLLEEERRQTGRRRIVMVKDLGGRS